MTTFDFTISLIDAELVRGAARYEEFRRSVNVVFSDLEQATDVYGTSRQHGPDRETQGLIVHQRAVHRRFDFERGYVVCRVGLQESFGDDPIEEGRIGATTLGLAFSGPRWGWCWARVQRTLAELEAQGGELMSSSTFSDVWLRSAEEDGDAAAVEAILAHQLAEARAGIANPRHLDLQRLPRLDIQALLLEVERPELIESLRLGVSGLVVVPEAVRACTGLRRINLSHNPISALPSWLSELRELREVNVFDTGLDERALDGILPAGHGVRLVV